MGSRMPVHMEGTFIYDIVMETSFEGLREELVKMNLGERKVCIVSDTNVAPLYLNEVEQIISGCFQKTEHFIFPAGEEHKNLNTVRELYETLIVKQFDRHDYLLALGGGVVGGSVRICSGHLSERDFLYTGTYHTPLTGGFKHWWKNRS